MKLLADENIDAVIVNWLRDQGYDVEWIVEASRGAEGTEIIRSACAQHRIIPTFDRNLGQLVFRCGMRPPGIVYLRLRTHSPVALLTEFQRVWPMIGPRALGHFVVVKRSVIRIRPL